jgi:hypothetical protein
VKLLRTVETDLDALVPLRQSCGTAGARSFYYSQTRDRLCPSHHCAPGPQAVFGFREIIAHRKKLIDVRADRMTFKTDATWLSLDL